MKAFLLSLIAIVLLLSQAFAANSVSESDFNDVLNAFRAIYPDVQISSEWEVDIANAQASVMFGDKIMRVTGGLARLEGVSPDVLTLMLCHEIGHVAEAEHVGNQGAGYSYNLVSEGGADYYATSSCFEKVARKLQSPPSKQFISADAKAFCGRQSQVNNALCVRALSAAEMIAQLQWNTVHSKGAVKPRLGQRDSLKVKEDNLDYPSAQCRLDTFVNGLFQKPAPACWKAQK